MAPSSAVSVAASSAAELLTPLPSGTSDSISMTAPCENCAPCSPARTANTPAAYAAQCRVGDSANHARTSSYGALASLTSASGTSTERAVPPASLEMTRSAAGPAPASPGTNRSRTVVDSRIGHCRTSEPE
jgi:hypothetical protein